MKCSINQGAYARRRSWRWYNRRCGFALGLPEGVDGWLVLSRAPEALDKDGVFLRVFRSPAIEPGGGWGEDKQEKDYSVFAHRENMI